VSEDAAVDTMAARRAIDRHHDHWHRADDAMAALQGKAQPRAA